MIMREIGKQRSDLFENLLDLAFQRGVVIILEHIIRKAERTDSKKERKLLSSLAREVFDISRNTELEYENDYES